MRLIKSVKNRITDDIKTIWPALIVLALYGLITQLCFGTVCPFKIVTHHNCPACGLTHSCLLIMTGKFQEAATWNISGFLWFPFILALLFWRYILGKNLPLSLFLAVICSIASILQWIL